MKLMITLPSPANPCTYAKLSNFPVTGMAGMAMTANAEDVVNILCWINCFRSTKKTQVIIPLIVPIVLINGVLVQFVLMLSMKMVLLWAIIYDFNQRIAEWKHENCWSMHNPLPVQSN